MTAGSGIIHQEMPQEHKEGLKGFQLWVNLPQAHKMMAPRYQEIVGKTIPSVEKDGVIVKVIAGEYQGTTGPRIRLDGRYNISRRNAYKK
ncbi:MAG: pirin family protein [Candidatus Yonathbacteria bacterium]|nr:pirin family protein [Candidatus Yonathbacteria bacterium]